MANQAYRSRVRQMLSSTTQWVNEQGHDLPIDPIRRKRPSAVGGGWGTLPLGVSVQVRTSRRIHHELWHFFETAYDADLHRHSFAGLLEHMTNAVHAVAGDKPWDRFLAWDFAALLELGPLPYGNRSPVVVTRPYYLFSAETEFAANWLRAFLADEPDWKYRLRDWVQRMASQAPKSRRTNSAD